MRTNLFPSGSAFRLQTDDPEVSKQAAKWNFATPTAFCAVGGYLRIWIVPKDKAGWVAETLALPTIKRERSERQKAHGRKLAQMGLPFRFAAPGDGIVRAKNRAGRTRKVAQGVR
jgi:hypothetical protein